MKPGLFTQEQIIEILREQEAGAKTADVCRKQWVLHRAPWAQMKPGLILTADESWGSGQLRRTTDDCDSVVVRAVPGALSPAYLQTYLELRKS